MTIAALLLLLAPALAARGDGVPLDPALAYRAEMRSPVTWDVELTFVVTPPHGTKTLRVWVPVPPTDSAQTIEGSAFETYPDAVAPRIETEPVFGNTFASFEWSSPKGAQMIRHRFRATTHELRFGVEPGKAAVPASWPEAFAPYLRSESQAVVIGDEVKRITAPWSEAASRDSVEAVRSVLDWVDANLRYDHASASLRASSTWALEKRTGHCSDYHGLCSAMTRSLGLPARVTYGIHTFPKDSPSHCKAEVFLPSHGWVSFDVSETQKLCERIAKDGGIGPEERAARIGAAKRRLAGGFRDNTWILQTRGTDYELAPKASRRVPVVRTLWAEADGVPLPEPDPGDATRREFAWMTLHRFRSDRPVPYPFTDVTTLLSEK